MSGLSKVIVVVPEGGGDARTARQLALGFEREGVPTAIANGTVPVDGAGLVVVGGADARALELVRTTRRRLDEQHSPAPLVFAGGGVARTEATAAGADEVIVLPTYLRDVVTVGRLLRSQPAGQRNAFVGSLAETTGVYTLVRALCALGRSAVLTLIRGLRRGEIRFFHGEVTSAQVGLIHGQAAFHQLLLWTEARFEYHREDIVRRHQIPLSAEELFADAERFLEGVRDASGSLSPSLVLEQDVAAIHALGAKIPTEVHGVLRMFDGHRVLADVLEDSPYRVFETLRVAQRAVDAGLLRIVESQRARATWRAVLRIEEWLVGTERPKPAIDTGPIARETGPVARESGPTPASASGSSRRKRKKKRASAPPPAATPAPAASALKHEIDWGALVPRAFGSELAPLSGVVPAAHTSGEIELAPTREAPRERLEETMNTEKRHRIFPMDVGLEPKVVFDETALVEAEAKAEAKAEADDAQLRAEAAEWAKQQAAARARAAEAQAREEEELARRVAETKAKVEEPRIIGRDEDTLDDADDTSLTGAVERVALDDTSDGIVQRIPTVATRPLGRPQPPPVVDDRPEARQGEIASRPTHAAADPRASEPSILVDIEPASVAPTSAPVAPTSAPPAPASEPAPPPQAPEHLVADLAAAHAAIAKVATAQAQAPATADLASASSELAVSDIRHGAQAAIADAATAFTDAEEAFFRAGTERPRNQPEVTGPIEKFDDLDEGYQPVGFWDRLRGKKPTK